MKSTQAVISRMVVCHRRLLVSALLSLSPLFALSQNGSRTTAPTATPATPFSAAAAQARRDQLAKIPELIGDPDPNARMANLETILNTHDSIMIQTALRLAFRSDDADLRALAMRAYIETLKEVTFDIILPDEWARQYDAVKYDQRSKDQLFNSHPAIRSAEQSSFRFHLSFNAYNRLLSSGEVNVSGNDHIIFTITGDRLSFKTRLPGYAATCYYEFRPSVDMTFHGNMNCERNGDWYFPPSTISARLF
jgi:hypothetical protein